MSFRLTNLRSKAMIEETYYHSPHSLVTTLVCEKLCFEVKCKLTTRVTIEVPWTEIDKKTKTVTRLQGECD